MRRHKSVYDAEIERILASMAVYSPEDPEYKRLIHRLESMSDLKRNNAREKISANTIALVGGNLLGILAILAYEQSHVITTKAIGMIRR